MKRVGYWIAVWLPAGLYLVSFYLPVAEAPLYYSRPDPLAGHEVFRLGFRVLLVADLSARHQVEMVGAWCANPAIWVALASVVGGRRRTGIVAASVACVLCMGVLPTWRADVLRYPGYWLWWGSAMTALLVALFVLPGRPQPDADDYRPQTSDP
jgi:hypothetical protein